jgi:hypothetical protein
MKRNLSTLALVIRLVEASPMRPNVLRSVLVYQIALEDPKGMVEYGWLRFGDGKVEFRFDVEELHQALRIDPNEGRTRANVFPPEPLEVGVGADPLWDRSLDG